MKNLTTFLLLILSTYCFGQFNETIRTGRPGQSIGAFTVGSNVLQFQQGLDYFGTSEANLPEGFISNNVIRYGILERVELSAVIDYKYQEFELNNNTRSLEGLSNLHLGFRVNINDQKEWLPATAFQMRLKLPNISDDFGSEYLAPAMVFVANWGLPKNMSLATNWILSYSGNDPKPTGKYVINFGFPIYKQLSGFIENYGQVNQSVYQTRFDTGLGYLINNNVSVDLFAGFGDNQNVTDYFVSTGISWRVFKSKTE
ncbi:transporter [Salegentibacter sp. LM13S]|uniref:transporter n=1 Tax=Salegentibacter lacus TaxID=2873599 RepID=UPI001CCB7C97|nr:transporter [Salegentibacter lacus]MBZ9630232.1 transporter [Salegentibacter lacus]